MNRSLLTPTILSFTVFLTLVLAASAVGQTDRNPLVLPCQEEGAPGKPTLKLRQPLPESPTAEADEDTQKTLQKATCEPESLIEPAKVEFKVALKIEGLVDLDESDLLKDLREHRVQAPKALAEESDFVAKASERIKQFLVERGYRHPTVAVRMEQFNADYEALVFVVHQGPRPSISEFRFEGNRIFSTPQLADEARQCMVGFGRDFYDPEVFEFCLHKLDGFARSQGYLQALFHDPKVEETGTGLIITTQVAEGILYRLGEIKIEGASLLASEKIRAMMGLQTGEVVNGERLSKWLFEEVKRLYGEHGYIQYTAEVTPEFKLGRDRSEGVVDFEINIDAGRRFTVRKIWFKGNDLKEDELRELFLIHDGDIFNQTLFEKSIDKLNDTSFFEPIDKDRDVDYRTNEEEGLVDIAIKLTKRQS